MGEFVRDRLPDPLSYFEAQGLTLVGRGPWRSTRCDFHGGSDSMRVKVASGGFCCMNCGVHGGDVLAYHIQAHNLEFVEAARALGAYIDVGRTHKGTERPATLSARDAMELLVAHLLEVFIHISDIRRGIIPSDNDWQRLVRAIGQIEALVEKYRS